MRAYLNRISDVIIEPFIQLLFFLAFIYFAWGIFIFIANAGNETKRQEGKSHMLWGIIGMLIMILALGIFALLQNTIFVIAQ